MDQLDIGEPLLVKTRWWDDEGTPTEPNTIALTITLPDATTIVKAKADMTQGDTTADWWYETLVTQLGLWRIHAEAEAGGDTRIVDSMVLVGVHEDAGPCEPWCAWEDVVRCGAINWPNGEPDEIQKQLWLEQGTEILYNLSGRKYPGLCTVTRSLCFACQHCQPVACSCDPYPGIDLGGRFPVWAVVDVTIDGVAEPNTAYKLRGRRWLIRTDGHWWPSGWNTADADRFRVTWITGRNVPAGGVAAAARYVQEIAKRCAGDSTCQLPSRVTSLQREGITYVVLDPMDAINEGRTSIDTVDTWLTADKLGSKPRPGVFHPALYGNRRIVP